MKKFATVAVLALIAGTSAAYAVEPVQGSLTYNANAGYLPKAPVGSNFEHQFIGKNGEQYREVYRVDANHQAVLENRTLLEK